MIGHPPVATWCWVRRDESTEWFPAFFSEYNHRWTNDDTWEDWENEIVEWIPIPTPEVIRKGIEAGL